MQIMQDRLGVDLRGMLHGFGRRLMLNYRGLRLRGRYVRAAARSPDLQLRCGPSLIWNFRLFELGDSATLSHWLCGIGY